VGDAGAVQNRALPVMEYRADMRARKTPTAAHVNKLVEAPKLYSIIVIDSLAIKK